MELRIKLLAKLFHLIGSRVNSPRCYTGTTFPVNAFIGYILYEYHKKSKNQPFLLKVGIKKFYARKQEKVGLCDKKVWYRINKIVVNHQKIVN